MTFVKGKAAGCGNTHAKLSDDDVWEIRRAREGMTWLPRSDPRSTYALAERFGVGQACISKIATAATWGHHLRREKC